MDNNLQYMLQNMALEQFAKTEIGQQLANAVHILESAQQHFYAVYEKQDELGMTGVKSATMITFAILRKIADGKKPSEFIADDWKEIAGIVSDSAVMGDDQNYSIFIFGLYESYIRFCIAQIAPVVPESITASVSNLADELCQKAEALKSGKISEVAYTEDCLWISLEAMFKLLASTAALIKDDRVTEFAQAAASFAFEYGRMMLYSKEQEIVNEFIESQYQLDAELEAKYAVYIDSLQKEAEQFYSLIDNAFITNFKDAFLHSVLLAKAAGVCEEDVLSSEAAIDTFFLD